MSQTGICSLPQRAGERDHVRAFERDCPDFQVLRDELAPAASMSWRAAAMSSVIFLTGHDTPELAPAFGADDRRIGSRTPGGGASRPGSGSLVDGKILRKTRFQGGLTTRPEP